MYVESAASPSELGQDPFASQQEVTESSPSTSSPADATSPDTQEDSGSKPLDATTEEQPSNGGDESKEKKVNEADMAVVKLINSWPTDDSGYISSDLELPDLKKDDNLKTTEEREYAQWEFFLRRRVDKPVVVLDLAREVLDKSGDCAYHAGGVFLTAFQDIIFKGVL